MSHVHINIVNCGVCCSVNRKMRGIFNDLDESFMTLRGIKGSPGNMFVKGSHGKVYVETSNTELLVELVAYIICSSMIPSIRTQSCNMLVGLLTD